MALVVRCPNAGCGHSTQLGEDPLGRVFRCPRCRAKLPTASAAPSIAARDLGTEGSSSRTSRSVAVASTLAACDSSAWNHPVLISTWQSSTLAAGEAESGEVMIGSFAPSEKTGRAGLDRIGSGVNRILGIPDGMHGQATVKKAPFSGLHDAGHPPISGFDFDFEEDDEEGSEVYIPPFSGGSGASWNHGVLGSRSVSERDVDRTASPDGPESGLTRIGRFRIHGILGEGTKATVYRAYDPLLDREVALKIPRPGSVKSAKAVARFLSEAKALARLRHPQIVPVYEAGQSGEAAYIAMALVEGRTLADVLREADIDPRRSAEVVRGLAEALAYAHDQGVVHRDVKPANVRIDAQGDVVLMDFGIAYLPDSGEMPVPPGVILGTPAYVSPEQAKGGQSDVLPASDQYSLGVVLYELLCGQLPFNGPPSYVLFHTIHQEPPSPRTVAPRVPRALASICLKALAKQPEDRYASCRALGDDLKRWLNGETPLAVRRSSWSLRVV